MKAFLASLLLLGATAAAAADAPPVGDRGVAYQLEAGLESRFRVFVPEDWKPGDRWPLVVMLHGGGGTEDSPFDRGGEAFRKVLFDAARAHHFILISPRGHKGGWGANMVIGGSGPTPRGTYRWPPKGAITGGPPDVKPRTPHDDFLAAEDVYRSIAQVAKAYGTLPRPYLMGNSMGGQGTLHLAQAKPARWCAIAPSDGPYDPETYPYARARTVRAALFVHGDNDTTAPIESMVAIAGGFDRAGVPTRLIVVPGGGHSDSWQRALPQTFAFFDRYPCGRR